MTQAEQNDLVLLEDSTETALVVEKGNSDGWLQIRRDVLQDTETMT